VSSNSAFHPAHADALMDLAEVLNLAATRETREERRGDARDCRCLVETRQRPRPSSPA